MLGRTEAVALSSPTGCICHVVVAIADTTMGASSMVKVVAAKPVYVPAFTVGVTESAEPHDAFTTNDVRCKVATGDGVRHNEPPDALVGLPSGAPVFSLFPCR